MILLELAQYRFGMTMRVDPALMIQTNPISAVSALLSLVSRKTRELQSVVYISPRVKLDNFSLSPWVRRCILVPPLLCLLSVSPVFSKDFLFLEDIGQVEKPNFSDYGMTNLRAIPTNALWRPTASLVEPDFEAIEKAVKRYQNPIGLVCLDIEHWSLSDEDDIRENLPKYISVLKYLKHQYPSLKVGFYSLVPVRNFYAPAYNAPKALDQWRKKNSRLYELGSSVDVIYPSLYAFNHDQQAWQKYAIANLAEARRYGKPVIAFLWPQVHDSNRENGLEFVSGEFWKLQLETVYRNADGVLIWTPHGPNKTVFNPAAEWWRVTEQFVQHPPLVPEMPKDVLVTD